MNLQTMKRIPSGTQERWRLLLSDGKWSNSFAMLATQLNDKVDSGQITNNCIIRMDRYVCNTVQENKKVCFSYRLILDAFRVSKEFLFGIQLSIKFYIRKKTNRKLRLHFLILFVASIGFLVSLLSLCKAGQFCSSNGNLQLIHLLKVL